MADIAERADTAVLDASRSVAEWIKRRADRIAFNSHPTWGSMGAVFVKDGVDIHAVRLHSDATAAVYFTYMLGKPVFDDLGRRQELLDRLNAVPGIRLPPDAVSKRKTIPLASFSPESTAAFLSAMDWFVAELPDPRSRPSTGQETAS